MTALLATCADPPTPPAIDVVALSHSKSPGIYYAGKRLTPWMPRRLRNELFSLRTTPWRATDRLRELQAMRAAESVVVRWEIDEAGLPSATKTLNGSEQDAVAHTYAEAAFTWGGEFNGWALGHALLNDVFASERGGYSHDRSTNDHIDWIAKILDGVGDEWTLSGASLLRTAAMRDLRVAVEIAARYSVTVDDLESEEAPR